MKYLLTFNKFLNENLSTTLSKLFNLDKNIVTLIYNSITTINPNLFKSKQSYQYIQSKILYIIKWIYPLLETEYKGNIDLFKEDLTKIIINIGEINFYTTQKLLDIKYNNLMMYKSNKDLYQKLFDIKSNLPEIDLIDKNNEFIKNNEAELVYEDQYWFVIWAKTEKANCYYGKNSNWCTTKGEFNNYNQRGKLYILIDKEKLGSKETNKRIQIHFESNSFMDMKDIPYLTMFDIDDIKNKGLYNFFKNDIETVTGIILNGYNENNNRLKQLLSFIRGLYIFKNLKQLYLKDNNLKELPKEIGNLTNLTYLNLFNNNLTELPKEIGNLTNLKELNLSDNNLTELPKEIENLINLKELYLSNNKLIKLPNEIGNLINLIYLNLYMNNLKELPKELGNLINLEELDLGNNKLIKLPEEIGNLTDLKELNLDSNDLTKLPKEIGNLQNLEILRLDVNKLTELPKEILDLQKNGLEITQ